jgi:ketosteroid isomerase-like protein
MKQTLFALLLFIVSCSPKETDLSDQTKDEIMRADITMSRLAEEEGFFKSLLSYADNDVVKLKEGEFPVIGKNDLTKYWAGKEDFKTLTWTPFKAEAAKSGDLGYTIGNWKFVTTDSTYYGNYYTVWKKQNDGSWKFVLDGGNNTPAQ